MMKWTKIVVVGGCLMGSSAFISTGWGQANSQSRPTPGTVSLEGTVLDAQTEQPINGVVVTAKSQSGTMRAQKAVTTNGTFQLILDPKQPYLISFKATGYEPYDEPQTFTSYTTTLLKKTPTRLHRIGTKPVSTPAPAQPATRTGLAKRMNPTDTITTGDGLLAVHGVVATMDKMQIPTATVQIRSLQGSVLAQTETADQAKFHFRVDSRNVYRIAASAEGYAPYNELLDLTSVNTATTFGKSIMILMEPVSSQTPTVPRTTAMVSAPPPPAVANAGSRVTPPKTLDAKVAYTPPLVVAPTGKTTQLQAIQFVQSKAELLPDAQPALEQLVTFLTTNPTAEIELRGHTDNQGDFDENLRLSKQRVDVVKEQLVKSGIAARRITTRGFGPTRPIASNNAEATRQLNRRVELVVLKP